MSTRPKYLLAVDPSLTCSGWAAFCMETERLLAVGKIKSMPASYSLSERLLDLHGKVQSIFKECGITRGDYLVCEAPTTMRDPRAALRVEQVRGIFETVARERKVIVPGRINPRSVQREVMGLKGKQLKRAVVKETAVMVVQALYTRDLKRLGFADEIEKIKRHQDIVDAILIGRLGVTRIKSAQSGGVPPSTLFEERLTGRGPRLRSRK